MEHPRSTETNNTEKSHVRCPRCDKEIFQAVAMTECVVKCDKCHRRYLINVQDGSVSIKLLSKPKEEQGSV